MDDHARQILLAVAHKAGQWISPETRATAVGILRVETVAAARRHRHLTGSQPGARRQTHADPVLTRAEAERILARLPRENADDVLRRRADLIEANRYTGRAE